MKTKKQIIQEFRKVYDTELWMTDNHDGVRGGYIGDKHFYFRPVKKEIEAFIIKALKYQQKEIEKAFKNKYKGAGDVFFPYESQGNCTEKEALDYIDEQWKDIINSLKRRE